MFPCGGARGGLGEAAIAVGEGGDLMPCGMRPLDLLLSKKEFWRRCRSFIAMAQKQGRELKNKSDHIEVRDRAISLAKSLDSSRNNKDPKGIAVPAKG
jgi:hypothetical protein